jgi:hypothetical protein
VSQVPPVAHLAAQNDDPHVPATQSAVPRKPASAVQSALVVHVMDNHGSAAWPMHAKPAAQAFAATLTLPRTQA